jgi:hypothetical protein
LLLGLAGALGATAPPCYLTVMPTTKTPRATSSDDLKARIERVTPDVLMVAADVPRSKDEIIAALAGRHPRNDIKRTIARLAVLGQLDVLGGKYVLSREPEED